MQIPPTLQLWILALLFSLKSLGADGPTDAVAAFGFDGAFTDSVGGDLGLLATSPAFTEDRAGQAASAAAFPATGMMGSNTRSYIKNRLQWSWLGWVRSDVGHNLDVGVLYSEGNNGISGHISVYRTNLMVGLWNETTGWSSVQSAVPLTLGTWHHVGVVYSAPTNSDIGVAEIYLNGNLIASGPLPYLKASGWRADRREFAFGASVGRYFGGQPSYAFYGALDDVQIFQRALSANEVLAAAGVEGLLRAVPALELVFVTASGKNYQLQYSEDLKAWRNHGEPFAGIGGETTRLVSARTEVQRFWRLALAPSP